MGDRSVAQGSTLENTTLTRVGVFLSVLAFLSFLLSCLSIMYLYSFVLMSLIPLHHKTQTSMPPAGFKPAILAYERPPGGRPSPSTARPLESAWFSLGNRKFPRYARTHANTSTHYPQTKSFSLYGILCGCETWSVIPKEEQMFRVSENRAWRNVRFLVCDAVLSCRYRRWAKRQLTLFQRKFSC